MADKEAHSGRGKAPDNGERRRVPVDPVRSRLVAIIGDVQTRLEAGILDTRERQQTIAYFQVLGGLLRTYDAEVKRRLPGGLPEELRLMLATGSSQEGEGTSEVGLRRHVRHLLTGQRQRDDEIAALKGEVRDLRAQLGSEGTDVVDVRQLEQERRDEYSNRWLHTLIRLGVRRGIRALRLDVDREVLSRRDFAEERLLIHEAHLAQIEKGGLLPNFATLLNIWERSLLRDFDRDSKHMQFLRLMSEAKGKQKIFDQGDIEEVPFGGLVRYFRVGLGVKREKLAEIFTGVNARILGKSEDALTDREKITPIKIAELERGAIDHNVKYKGKYLPLIFDWLQLEEDDPLRDIFIQKAKNYPVDLDEATYQRLVASRFLFQDPSYHEPLADVSEEDRAYMAITEQFRDEGVGAAVRMIREMSGRKQIDVMTEVGTMHGSTYINFETGNKKSLDQTIVEILYGLDNRYTIHHPLVQLLLDIADEERKKKGEAAEAELVEEVCDLGYHHRRRHPQHSD